MSPPPQAARTFEFWLGRAGSGKTWACLDSIAGHLIERPRGEPLLFLVPEQATASMEYALAARLREKSASRGPGDPRIEGYTRARVLSFKLLVKQVFSAAGGEPAGVVDEQTRVLLLRRVLRRRRSDLRLFGGSSDLPGLAASLSRSLGEFQNYGWKSADLRARGEALAEEGSAHEVLRRKLDDLALVWEDYLALLGELGWEDLPRRNEAAAERLAEWSELEGARLWIDGFASFTEEELRLLDAVLARAAGGYMALCLDPYDESFIRLADPAAALGPPAPRVGVQRTFENLEHTYLQLRARLRESGWHTRDEFLPRGGPTRFSESRGLGALEGEVLTRLRPPAERNIGWEEFAGREGWPSGPIELLEAPSRRAEVEAVARRIAALALPSPALPAPAFDWSQLVVLARDLKPYEALVREIFPRYGIPFFIDAVRSLSRHPLSRLLSGALHVARFGWSAALAMDYLKTGLAAIQAPEVIARIERVALQRRLQSGDWTRSDAWVAGRDRDNEAERRRVGLLFDEWRRAAEPLERLRAALLADNADPAAAIWTFLTSLDVAGRLDAWIAEARARGDEEAASIHERAWSNTVELLDRLHRIGRTGDGAADPTGTLAASRFEHIDELGEILETALHDIKGRLIPPRLEQVLVGAVDRSRTPPTVRAAFVLGLADGEFPRAYEEDPILGDRERKALTEGPVRLGPDSARKFSLERFFAYIALTRASQILVATRPLLDERGRPLQPSAPFRAIAAAFPLAGPRNSEEFEAGPVSSLPQRPEHWAARTTRLYHRASAGDDEALKRLLALPHPLALLAPDDMKSRKGVSAALSALLWPRTAALDPARSARFWQADPHLSATGLEGYGACPFKFFASRMLRLERRVEITPGPLELGELRHALLEALFKRLGEGGPLDWGKVDLRRAGALVDELAPAIAAETLEDRFGRDALTGALLNDAVEDIKIFLKVLRTMGERYGFVQAAAEYRFGADRHEPLKLPGGDGWEFTLRGSVDRVDAEAETLAGDSPNLVLFDFKSSAHTSQHTAARYLHGLSLQLALYGLALRRGFEREAGGGKVLRSPARISGFFYWPLGIGLARENETDSPEPASETWFGKHPAKGLFDSAIARSLDTRVGPGERALAFNYRLTTKGELNKNNFGWIAGGGFSRYLAFVDRLVRDRAAEIAGGAIAVAPLATPFKACEMCEFAPVCRIGSSPPSAWRYLPGIMPGDFRDQFSPSEDSRA